LSTGPKQTAVQASTDKPTTDAGEARFIKKIQSTEDVFALYNMREELLGSPDASPEVLKAVSEAFAQCVAACDLKVIDDSLELVAFKWALLGEAPGEGKEARFRALWLFHKTGPIRFGPDQELRLIFVGYPEKAHVHYLAAKGQPDQPYTAPYIASAAIVKPSTANAWSEGEYHMVTKQTTQPFVPYEWATYFKLFEREPNGPFLLVGEYCPRLYSGWQVGL